MGNTSGNINITLGDDLFEEEDELNIKHFALFGTGTVTVTTTSPGTIDGSTSLVLERNNSALIKYLGSNNWRILVHPVDEPDSMFDNPRISSFSIDIPSRVDLNTNLNVQKTLTYDVLHNSNIQSLALEVVTGDNKTLTIPSSDGLQSQSVTLSGIVTSSETSVTFRITGTATNNSTFQSNLVTVSVRNLADHEYIYYGLSSTNNPDTIDINTISQTEVISGDNNVSTGPTTAGQYFIILIPSSETLVRITDTVLQQDVTSVFTKTDDVRQINTENYDSYVIGPLNPGGNETYLLEVQ